LIRSARRNGYEIFWSGGGFDIHLAQSFSVGIGVDYNAMKGFSRPVGPVGFEQRQNFNGPQGSCTFNTPGTYWLRLFAVDDSGNSDVMSAYAVATPDTHPPTVRITNPAGLVTGDVAITADAADNIGVTRVDFYLDSTEGPAIGSATTIPYTITWDSTTTTTGRHMLIATATDATGNIGTSPPISIVVDPSHVR
jgi:hypothetical protein